MDSTLTVSQEYYGWPNAVSDTLLGLGFLAFMGWGIYLVLTKSLPND